MFYFHFCLFAYHVDSFTACAYAFITMCDMACGGAADELNYMLKMTLQFDLVCYNVESKPSVSI